jgi:acyl-coenzyme A synthetase/AMP-(fatty) acid ligase
VELGEIEALVRTDSEVKDLAVLLRNIGTRGSSDARLIAYVTLHQSGGNCGNLEERIKSKCKQSLPSYMVPSHVIVVTKWVLRYVSVCTQSE